MCEVSGSCGQRDLKSQIQVQRPETEIKARPQNQKIKSEIRRSRTSQWGWFIWEGVVVYFLDLSVYKLHYLVEWL